MKKFILFTAVVIALPALVFYFAPLQVGRHEPPAQATYINATADIIKISSPLPGESVSRKFKVAGLARGPWYFEASFPVILSDRNGTVLFQAPAKAMSEWMTGEFVPFEASIDVPATFAGPAILTLKKDNPSDIRTRDASISLPLMIQ